MNLETIQNSWRSSLKKEEHIEYYIQLLVARIAELNRTGENPGELLSAKRFLEGISIFRN